MKQLNYYKERNVYNSTQAFDYFISTLKESIFTWDYFVNFDKCITNIESIKPELLELNRLIGVGGEEFNELLKIILKNNPKVRNTLPILIASRKNKIAETPIISDIETMIALNKKDLFDYKKPLTDSILDDIIEFFEQSKLKNLFLNSSISNLVDYCLGVEVGMDTNGRKNRTGTNMEKILEDYIKVFCSENNLLYMSQATKIKLKLSWNIDIEVDKIDRRFDFAILDSNNQLSLIEVNYYSGGGSKLKATAGEYKTLQKDLKKQDITFIWVTDGFGWKTAKTALNETFLNNDYTLNLEMLTNGVLKEILLEKVHS